MNVENELFYPSDFSAGVEKSNHVILVIMPLLFLFLRRPKQSSEQPTSFWVRNLIMMLWQIAKICTLFSDLPGSFAQLLWRQRNACCSFSALYCKKQTNKKGTFWSVAIKKWCVTGKTAVMGKYSNVNRANNRELANDVANALFVTIWKLLDVVKKNIQLREIQIESLHLPLASRRDVCFGSDLE